MVYVSAQAILGSRLYVLYGNQRPHLIGLTFICCVLPVAAAIFELSFHKIAIVSPYLLVTYNVMGLLTDMLLFVLILAHAFRSRSRLQLEGVARNTYPWAYLSMLVDSGTDMLSLMVSDSVKYYSFMLVMYIVTSATFAFRITEEVCDGFTQCESIGSGRAGITAEQGILTLISMMTGIMAPKLLLNVRKEFYNCIELQHHEVQTATTWRFAGPSRHAETSTNELSTRTATHRFVSDSKGAVSISNSSGDSQDVGHQA